MGLRRHGEDDKAAAAALVYIVNECLEDVFDVALALGIGLHLFLRGAVRRALRANQ